MDTTYKHLLVGQIKGFALEAQHLRKEIKKALKEEYKWKYAYVKHKIGWQSRHLLLAYACIRGVPYRVVEPSYRAGNAPSPKLLLEIIKANSPYAMVKVENSHSLWEPKWTEATVKQWLGLETPTQNHTEMPLQEVSHPASKPFFAKVMAMLGL